MHLHEIQFVPLEHSPGWSFARLTDEVWIWLAPDGGYSIDIGINSHGRRTKLYNADALTTQCVLFDLFK